MFCLEGIKDLPRPFSWPPPSPACCCGRLPWPLSLCPRQPQWPLHTQMIILSLTQLQLQSCPWLPTPHFWSLCLCRTILHALHSPSQTPQPACTSSLTVPPTLSLTYFPGGPLGAYLLRCLQYLKPLGRAGGSPSVCHSPTLSPPERCVCLPWSQEGRLPGVSPVVLEATAPPSCSNWIPRAAPCLPRLLSW